MSEPLPSEDEPPTLALDYEPAEAYPIPQTSLLSIEHPAILTSIETGLRTLGGEKAIAKVQFLSPLRLLTQAAEDHEKATLELRYRPDDPYQHAILSQPVKAQNIVLKLGKNKDSGKTEKVEVVGVVDTILRFRGILSQD
jgi:hypothetical protein